MTTKKIQGREPKIVLVKADIVSFLQALEQHLKDGYTVNYSEFLAAQAGCCTATLTLEG